MNSTPATGDRVTYINDDRVFVCTGETTYFGWRVAVQAHVEGEPGGERFWLLVEYCEPA